MSDSTEPTSPDASPESPHALLARAPQQARSRRTLERILKAAWGLLEEEGPEGLTVTGVASRARISVGSFYARFEGRDELLRYMEATSLDETLGAWEEVTNASFRAADPRAVPRHLLEGFAALYLEGPAHRLHLLAQARVPGSEGRLAALEREAVTTLVRYLPSGTAPSIPLLRAAALVAGARELALASRDRNRGWLLSAEEGEVPGADGAKRGVQEDAQVSAAPDATATERLPLEPSTIAAALGFGVPGGLAPPDLGAGDLAHDARATPLEHASHHPPRTSDDPPPTTDRPDDAEPPEDAERPGDAEPPEDAEPPGDAEPPDDDEPPEDDPTPVEIFDVWG